MVDGPARPGGIKHVRIGVVNHGRRASIVGVATRTLKALRSSSRSAPPALRAADGLDRASRDSLLGIYRRPARKFLTTVGGGATVSSSSPAAVRSPLHIAGCGARSNRRSQATVRSLLLNPFLVVCSCDVTSRETDSRIGSRFGLRPGAESARATPAEIITLPRRHACQQSMRQGPHPVHPFHCENSHDIDAGNGQAYHGQLTTITNGSEPTVSRSRSGEGQRTQRQQRGHLTSRVRSCPGTASRTRVLRDGDEAAIANDPMRCRT